MHSSVLTPAAPDGLFNSDCKEFKKVNVMLSFMYTRLQQ